MNTLPTTFNAGITVTWTVNDIAAHPQADGFTMKATINGTGGKKILNGTYENGVWNFRLPASANDLLAGQYLVFHFVEKGTGEDKEIYQIGEAQGITVNANFVTEQQTDVRTHAQIMVAKLQTFLERIAENPIHSQTIGGRAFSRNNILEAKQLLNQYRAEIRQAELDEQIANGEGGGEILSTFENELA